MARRIFSMVLAGLCVVVTMAWLADFAIFEYRVRKNRNPYGSVTVHEYYAIGEKNQRTEYMYKSTEQQTCSNSLFPRSGSQPCWYARKHTEKQVSI